MANLGQNTSGIMQAIIRITPEPESCITEMFARELERVIRVEFPSGFGEDGRVDVLSQTALAQVAAQLAESSSFQQILLAASQQPAFQQPLIDALVGSDAFKALLTDVDGLGSLAGSGIYTVNSSKQVNIPAANSGVAFYNLDAYSSVGAGVSTGHVKLSSTPTEIVISFPSGIAGDLATISWVRIE